MVQAVHLSLTSCEGHVPSFPPPSPPSLLPCSQAPTFGRHSSPEGQLSQPLRATPSALCPTLPLCSEAANGCCHVSRYPRKQENDQLRTLTPATEKGSPHEDTFVLGLVNVLPHGGGTWPRARLTGGRPALCPGLRAPPATCPEAMCSLAWRLAVLPLCCHLERALSQGAASLRWAQPAPEPGP